MVIDASALLPMLLHTAAPVLPASYGEREAHAPHLLDLEVAHALRRLLRAGNLDATRAVLALDDLKELPLHRHAHGPLLPRVWELRHNLTAYDAAYLALAESLDCPLLTRDRGLAAVARATVEVVLV